MRRKENGEGQMEFAPIVTIPAIMVPQPGGAFLVKPGKPIVESDRIGTARAARILGLSQRRVQSMCDEGVLECERPGGERGWYRIKTESVMRRKSG